MDECLKNNNLLTQIIVFLNSFEIVILSMCNKHLKKALDTKNNSTTNIIFMFNIIEKYFSIEPLNYFSYKKNLLGKNVIFSTDWKSFLKQLKVHISQYEDKTITNRVLDFLKIHLYLPDLRKECFHLEFENSSIHELICYDINSRLIHTYNYYSKHIKFENIILHPENKSKIKILREKLMFEAPLANFGDTFKSYIEDIKYIDFVNNEIIEYRYDDIYNSYLENNFKEFNNGKNKDLNDIFKFILWINFIFIMYCKFNYGYINGLFNNINDEELLTEYITKKSDLINTALLINSTFNNVNIIINFLVIFKKMLDEYIQSSNANDSESNKSLNNPFDEKKWIDIIISPNKFTLYNLFLNIIENIYTSKLQAINEVFQRISKNYFEEVFSLNSKELINKPKITEEENMKNEIKCLDEDEDEDISMDINDMDEKPTNKELIENFANACVDRYINANNANAIMHSNFKIDASYINDVEKILINLLVEQILKSLNVEKMSIEDCFEIVDKITKCKGNSKILSLNKDSLVLIRRTQKRLMKEGFNSIFSILMKLILDDFAERINQDRENLYLSVIEQLNIHDYKCDMEVLSSEGECNVIKYVKEDYEKAISCLIKNFNLNEEESKLAHDYFYNVKIPLVLLFKKLVYNYYKQLEIYKERNEKVEYYLKNNLCKKWIYNIPEDEDNKEIEENKGQRNDELWNNYVCRCKKD